MNCCPWCGSSDVSLALELKDYFLSQEDFRIMNCPHCHLLFTDPLPDKDHISHYYESDKYLSHQENKSGFIPRVYEYVKSFNLRNKVHLAIDGLKTGAVLDIGCGVGDFLLALKNKGWSVTGIEPSDHARNLACNRLGSSLLTPNESYRLADHSFDLITMWHVLEHVDDLHTQLAEIQRLLKPGGRLVLALPNHQSFDATYYQKYWAAWDVPRHVSHFCPQSIQAIFSDSSLKPIDTQKLKWDAYYISYLSEGYRHHRLALLRGFFIGCRSNCKAHRTGQYSSLVYRFQKE